MAPQTPQIAVEPGTTDIAALICDIAVEPGTTDIAALICDIAVEPGTTDIAALICDIAVEPRATAPTSHGSGLPRGLAAYFLAFLASSS
jgi:hypothetical protein